MGNGLSAHCNFLVMFFSVGSINHSTTEKYCGKITHLANERVLHLFNTRFSPYVIPSVVSNDEMTVDGGTRCLKEFSGPGALLASLVV